MAKKRRIKRRRPLLWIAILACLAIALSALSPHLLQLLSKGQFRFNPRAKLQADETYQLEFWVERPNIPDIAPWQAGLQQAIDEFRTVYPNVEVSLVHLSPQDVDQRMNDALNQGTPPDLFFSANQPCGNLGELQLPLHRYIDKTERLAWPDSMWQQLQRSDGVYALPVAAYPRVFMANSQLLADKGLEADAFGEGEWNWPALLALAEKLTAGQVVGYLPTSTGQSLLTSLAASIGKPSPFDNDGELAWTKEDLVNLAEIWLRLMGSAGAPKGGGNMDSNCLDLFLSKRAAMIGPLNHQLTAWLWQAADKRGIVPQLMAIPAAGPEPYADVRVLGIALLRQQDYQGDRHTRAAAELAQFLVPRLGGLLASLTGALPAVAPASAATWLPYDEESFAIYSQIENIPRCSYAYGPPKGLSVTHWQLGIAPAWDRLVQGQYTAEQFAEAVLAELAMATIAGP
jgi:multiple sugar transport system substrate-binding protein